jgi:hypothetical protein
VRLGLANRGGESSCSSRSGGSGVRVSARPAAIFVSSRRSRSDLSTVVFEISFDQNRYSSFQHDLQIWLARICSTVKAVHSI